MGTFDSEASARFLVEATAKTPPVIEFPAALRPPDLDAGYQVQKRFEELRPIAQRAVGFKVAAMTQKSRDREGLPEPVFGGIRGDLLIQSGLPLKFGDYVKLLVECEIVAKVQIKANGGYEISQLIPSMEICDFRSQDRDKAVVVSDNWNNAGNILGAPVSSWDDEKLKRAMGYISVDGKELVRRCVGDVITHPKMSIEWLIQSLPRRGRKFEDGMLVSTGSLCGEIFLQRGNKVVAGVEGLGEVTTSVL